jgi:hypothetical protein
MMNIGFYLKSIDESQYCHISSDLSAYLIDNNKSNDCSIFYNSIGPSSRQYRCGTFNSTELWNFNGKLVVFSLECAEFALKIVNNFELYYIFGFEKCNVLHLLELMQKNMKIICIDKESKKHLYRLTGQFPVGTSNNIKNIVNYIVK